ncbi:MAG: hypothetical protein NT120_00590 [Candidatus Aenigmarchaeota archaeon]|nr:hypothetical protein [Candidatus Aenigmarchaeota archaeon]
MNRKEIREISKLLNVNENNIVKAIERFKAEIEKMENEFKN